VTRGSEENTSLQWETKHSMSLHRRRLTERPANNHLWDHAENLDSTSRVLLNSNAGKLSRLMVATRKYGGKYDIEANSKEG
jgi:hypothetical protein